MAIAAEKRQKLIKFLSAYASYRIGKKVTIIPISGEELGYMDGTIIYVNFEHSLIRNEDDVIGLVAHEILHFLMDDIEFMKEMEDKYKKEIKSFKLFRICMNLVMDAHNENHPKEAFGNGRMRDCLRSLRKNIYDNTPGLGLEKDPITQVLNAFIMVGDAGNVKGNFTFPEAEKTYLEVFDDFNQTTNGKMNETKIMGFFKGIEALLEESEEDSNGKGEGENQDQNQNNNQGNAQGSGESSDNESSEESKGNSGNSGDSNDSDGDSNDSYGNGSEGDNSKGDSDTSDSNSNQANGSGGNGCSTSSSSSRKFSKEELDKILSDFEEKMEKEKRNAKKHEAPAAAQKTEKQSEGEGELEYYGWTPEIIFEEYEKLKDSVKVETSLFKRAVENIFKNDKTRETVSSKGKKLDIKQLYKPIPTENVFRRKTKTHDIDDVFVTLIVDCSGSMAGSGTQAAQKCACVFNEAFAKLGKTVYNYGFSNYKVTDFYNTSAYGLSRVVTLVPIGGTCDSEAVRQASLVIKKRPEKHKITFIIGDGCGCGDMPEEVEKLRKISKVVGVSLGEYDNKWVTEIYGNDLVLIKDDDFPRLITELPKVLKRTLKSWKA